MAKRMVSRGGVASLWLAASIFATPYGAAAAPIVERPSDTLASFSLAEIEPVLQSAGFETRLAERDGSRALVVTSKAGRTALLIESVCGADGACSGLWMVAALTGAASVDDVNAFNMQARTTRASVHNGAVVLDRYLIADYGTARGSFVVNVNVFLGVVDLWFEYARGLSADFASFDASPQDDPLALIGGGGELSTAQILDWVVVDASLRNNDKIEN